MTVFTVLIIIKSGCTYVLKITSSLNVLSVILETKGPTYGNMLSESPIAHYTILLSSVCGVSIAYLYRLLNVRMKYGNRIGICSNLLMFDSIRELKFMCCRERDAI
jgi:hypothetical protein